MPFPRAVAWSFVAALGALSLTYATSAGAGCTKQQHSVKVGDDTTNLEGYDCSIGQDANNTALRVTFYRSSESVAGSLVMSAPLSPIAELVGQPNFIENDVFTELKNLFANFGSPTTHEDDFWFEWSLSPVENYNTSVKPFSSSEQTTSARIAATQDKPVKLWSLFGVGPIVSDGVVLKAPSETILNSSGWPAGYQMDYDCFKNEKHVTTCTTVWKYTSAADFGQIGADVKQAYQRAEQKLRKWELDNLRKDDAERVRNLVSQFEKNIELFQYLDKHKLPEHFLFVSNGATPSLCDANANWTMQYSPRQLVFDFAVLENITDHAQNITDFIGRSGKSGFQLLTDASRWTSDAPSSLDLGGGVVLQPHEKIAVALRIAFTNDPIPKWISRDSDIYIDEIVSAQQTFDEIRAKPAHYQFKDLIGGFNNAKSIVKTRESFLPPSAPELADYAYGTEIDLTGLIVDGERVDFEGQESPNALQTRTLSFDLELGINKISFKPLVDRYAGCCPVLYSWRQDRQEWVYHGKVLHLADSLDSERVDHIPLSSLRTRFRIAEEEPEATVINHVQLNLMLRDGRNVQLQPRQGIDRAIRANTAVEVEFELPAELSPNEVLKSEIEIRGYYLRYSRLLSAGSAPLAVP